MSDRRQGLLDFIVTNASPAWIEKFVKQKLIEIERRLVNENKWIEELEQEPNERVLLRTASELGYSAVKSPTPVVQSKVEIELPPPVGKRTGRKGQHGKPAKRAGDPHTPRPEDSDRENRA